MEWVDLELHPIMLLQHLKQDDDSNNHRRILMKTNFYLTIIFAFVFSCNVMGGGIETKPITSSKTVSLNGLYFAGADGISKSFSNPAGLIYINESGIEFSALDRLAQSEFDNPSRGLFKSFREDEFNFNGGFIWSISDQLKTAISYQQVFDYNVSWPYANYFKTDSLSSLLVFDFYNKINVEAFSAAVAYRFNDFVFGITPVLYHVSNKIAFPQNNSLWTSGVGTAAYQFEYDMEAWTFGFNAGIIAELTSDLNIAFSLRSAYSADLEGDAKSRMFAVTDSTDELTDIKSTFEMPWMLGVGAVYSFSPEIKINLDIQYSLWGSTQESANISFNNSIWQNSLNQTDPGSGVHASRFNFEYRNTLDIGLGFEYTSPSDISYRAGYLFTQSHNSDFTYSMLFPSVDRHTLTIGAGLSEGNLRFDAALLYSFGVKKEVVNEIPILSGAYNYDIIIPMVTIQYLIF